MNPFAKAEAQPRLYALVQNPRGADLYAMPGGRALVSGVRLGSMLLIAGKGVRSRTVGRVFFPVQYESSIVWASEADCRIVKEKVK